MEWEGGGGGDDKVERRSKGKNMLTELPKTNEMGNNHHYILFMYMYSLPLPLPPSIPLRI